MVNQESDVYYILIDLGLNVDVDVINRVMSIVLSPFTETIDALVPCVTSPPVSTE